MCSYSVYGDTRTLGKVTGHVLEGNSCELKSLESKK